MSWKAIFGIACVVSFVFPVGVIIYNRYYTHRSLVALLLYFIMKAFNILMYEGLLPVSKSFFDSYSIMNNYLDAPLMLTALLFFCPARQKQRVNHYLIGLFIAYEIIITCFYGFKPGANVLILGPGRLLILIYTFVLFVRQVKFSIMHRKNQGRIFMLAAILLGYGCYILIYYFFYILKTQYVSDVLILYFISSFVASILMGVGLHLMRKRMKELQALRTTRRELALFFSHN